MKSFNINSIINAMVMMSMIAVSDSAMAANIADRGKDNNSGAAVNYSGSRSFGNGNNANNNGNNSKGNSKANKGYKGYKGYKGNNNGYGNGYDAGYSAGYNAGYKNGKKGFYDNGFGFKGASYKEKKKYMKMGYFFDSYGNMFKVDKYGKKKYYNKYGKEIFYINIGGFVFYIGF